METNDIYHFWQAYALNVLRALIAEGMGNAKLLEWALNLGREPLLRAFEKVAGRAQEGLGIAVRTGKALATYEEWEKSSNVKVAKVWAKLSKALGKLDAETGPNPYLDELCATVKLDTANRQIVCLAYLSRRFRLFDQFLEELTDDELQSAQLMACPAARTPLTQYFRRTSVLRTSGVVGVCHGFGVKIPYLGAHGALESNVYFTLTGDTPEGFRRVFFRSAAETSIPLERFPCRDLELSTIQALLRRDRPAVLLWHGEPGTGKSEFAKALAQSLRRQAAFVNFEQSHRPEAQFAALALAANFHDAATQVLVVDEADGLLNTQRSLAGNDSADKGLLNDFLDRFQGKAIFISNSTSGIEASVLRRFHFTLEFKPFAPDSRKRLWLELGQASGFSVSQLGQLATTYQANPAQISNVLQIASDLRTQGLEPSRVFEAARGMLESTQKLLWRTTPLAVANDHVYSEAWLNLDRDPASIVAQLRRWKGDSDSARPGMNLLFHGLPGTGKSAFARHLADELGLTLHHKRASDLLSPFVGATEANLREAFDQAEGGVLVLDEADSYFVDRASATHSWERSQTNEMLQALESFRGLFIATTNLVRGFDQAAFRRFTLKVTFRPLSSDQKQALAQTSFPAAGWDAVSLAATVRTRLKYRDGLYAHALLRELRAELEHKASVPGRVGFGI